MYYSCNSSRNFLRILFKHGFLIFIIIKVFSSAFLTAARNVTNTGSGRIQICHSKLFVALDRMCDRFYTGETHNNNHNGRSKRSEVVDEIVSVWERDEDGDYIPRRLPRSVVERCCRRPCNESELAMYCSNIRVTRRRAIVTEPFIQNPSQTTPSATTSNIESITENSLASSVLNTSSRRYFESVTESETPDPIPIGDLRDVNYYFGI